MNRKPDFLFPLLFAAVLLLASCSTSSVVQLKPTGPDGKHVYKITVLGFSETIRDGAKKNAAEFCEKRNSHVEVIKDVITSQSVADVEMLLSIDLQFVCLPGKAKDGTVAAPSEEEIKKKQEIAEAEKKAREKAEREKGLARTGDSPGVEEPLGDISGKTDREDGHLFSGGTIVEEVLDK